VTVLHYLLCVLLGYLIGGIPSAHIGGRLRGMDVRKAGSGNVGATNALRVLGWRWGVAVMAVDVGKGYLVTAGLPRIMSSGAEPVYLAIAAGGAAVLGHVFTPYLRFRGGKGVATAAGSLLALAPWATAICLAVFVGVALATKTVSIASIVTAGAFPITVALLPTLGGIRTPLPVLWLSIGLASFVVWTHRENLRRLISGTENRFGRS